MRQRRPIDAAVGRPPRDPVHHRGLYAQIIGGLIVAAVLVAFPVIWTKLTRDSPEQEATKIVAQLTTGVALSRYEQLLGGPPPILRPVPAPGLRIESGLLVPGDLREALWVADLYAVQALLDRTDQVLGYSVTTRSERFTPPLERLTDQRLGTTHFVDVLPGDDNRLVDSAGTARGVWWYSEAIEPGGATHEDTLVFTAGDGSDLGLGGLATVDIGNYTRSTDEVGPMARQDLHDPALADLRTRLTVGTYTVLGPGLELARLPEMFRFGATFDDIQAIHPTR